MLKNIVLLIVLITICSKASAQVGKNSKGVDEYFSKINNSKNSDTLVKYYSLISRYYQFVSIDSALKYGKLSTQISKTSTDQSLKGKASLVYASILSSVADYQNAINEFKTAEIIFIELGDKKYLGNVYNNLGGVYNGMGDYSKAIDTYFKALKLFEELNYLEGEVSARFSIIAVYFNLGELHEAEKKCIELYPKVLKLNNDYKTCFYHHTIGSIYKDSLPDKALEHFTTALSLAKKVGEFQSLAYVQLNIAEIYFSKYKRNKKEVDYKLAKEKFEEAKITCETNKVGHYLSACYNSLAELALIKNDTKNCITLSYQAIKLGNESLAKINLLSTYSNLYQAYEKEKRYDSSLVYAKKYLVLKDELSKNEIKTKMMGEELNYQVEKNNAINQTKIAEKERDITLRNAIIIVLGCLALIIGLLIAFLYMRYQREKQKEFSILLIQTQEEERKRISKDLHDGIGQNLLMIKSECGNNTSLVEITIDELRTISRNLHPVQLEKLGLKEAIESNVEQAEKASGIFFSHEIENINNLLSSDQQINLYRIIQESINNIIKHSKAKSARLTISKENNTIITTIFDDGIGFDILAMKKKKSLGLTSMSERAKLINGSLVIMSGNKGTRTEIKINYA